MQHLVQQFSLLQLQQQKVNQKNNFRITLSKQTNAFETLPTFVTPMKLE